MISRPMVWLQIRIAAGLDPLRFENRKPNPPLSLRLSELLKSQANPDKSHNRRIRAAKWPQIRNRRPQG